MRTWIFGVLLALLMTPAQAEDLPRAGVEGVISGQISAFQADDFAKAFTFASPFIQRLFGTSDNFGAMVQRGYPMVWRPADVQFGALRAEGPALYQEVRIVDAQGTLHVLQYELIEAGDSFVINGVEFIEAPQIGA